MAKPKRVGWLCLYVYQTLNFFENCLFIFVIFIVNFVINGEYFWNIKWGSGISLLFESSSSSSISSSESEEEMSDTKVARIQNYEDVIGRYSTLQFKQHFRLTRIVADRVISMWLEFLLQLYEFISGTFLDCFR